MKRILSLVLTLSLAITCVGCSNSSPKPVIETFCNAMQSFDMNAMATCMENANDVEDPFSNEDLENSFSSGEALNYLKDCVGKMTYIRPAKPDQLFHESKITVRFWIVTIVLAAITIITLKIR